MGNSRTADKFVVRLPDGMRAKAEEAADNMHTSMNTFFVQAVEEKLASGVRQELLLDALQQAYTKVEMAPRLIGWRTENYLWETADPAVAKNWEPNIGVLPIFEGDAITKLPEKLDRLQGDQP